MSDKILTEKKRDTYKIDMCRGPLFKQIVVFSIPLMLSGLLQLLFNAVDLMVVGRFASHQALAAVGATNSLTYMIINIFVGLSVGTNVLVARYIGEQNRKGVSRTTHTAILTSLIGGIILALIGIFCSKTMLRWLETPEDILDMSALYMKIYFAGMPVIMLYNFGSAILRAAGDTRRPFYFLVIGGILNVFLNLIFVLCLGWDVGGVATATVISQALSAGLVLYVLMKLRDSCRVKWQGLHIEWRSLREMMWIGIPTGFQSSCFSLANLLIQYYINSFGSKAVAGTTAAVSWEIIFFMVAAAIGQTTISFIGQNSGGKQYLRIHKTIRYCSLLTVFTTIFLSVLLFLFARPMLELFNSDPEVIEWGILRFKICVPVLFICALQETFIGALRGFGYSIMPTVIMLFGICVLRMIWIFTIFRAVPTMQNLLLTYPVSWMFTMLASGIYLFFVLRKYPKENTFPDF
ncbi:MAG: MATE family efflux transporter [Lentisphaeria bacterium]|nr:MATE family efflux transporter [Lentisphaeria bacterium]